MKPSPTSTSQRPVFFSYSRRDGAFCLKVAEDLKRIGVEAWIDQLDIPPGEPWDRAVEAALRRANTVLVFLSPDAVESDNVLDEISFAVDNAQQVIPVLFRACDVPLRLRRLQYVDFSQDYSAALQQLASRLGVVSPQNSAPAQVLKTLWMSELVDRTRLVDQLGDRKGAELFQRHGKRARELLLEHGGLEIAFTDRLLALFDRPIQAVHYALVYHRALAELSGTQGVELTASVGIHLGEILLHEATPEEAERGATPLEVEGLAKSITTDLTSLAIAKQTLISQAAFDTARRGARDSAPVEGELRWLAHGDFLPRGITTPMAVFEVGLLGVAPLTIPPDTPTMRRVPDSETILGWRPATGLEIPRRPDWTLAKKLGEGGFGEVWLASHGKTDAKRVFKFCFGTERLKALRREITLFRLLKETLGERDDIARILDWGFDEEPYFIESEYTTGGDLKEWAAKQGGVARIDLETRIEIVAQVGDALAAAHSVGVLHKDIKPTNVLIHTDLEDQPKVRVTDFGIGIITDESQLLASGITVISLTELKASEESSSSGTRLYMAPELVEGKTASVQADIYALGVLLYQLVVGELTKSLAPGWERDVADPLLREIIGWAVDGAPEKRLADGGRLARRLRTLDSHRAELQAEQYAREEAERNREALERTRKRRKVLLAALAFLLVIAGSLGILLIRISQEKKRADREAEATQQVADFLIDLFEVSDPDQAQGETITVREVLERGAETISEKLEDQPLVQARIQDTVGTIYHKLGLYNEATKLLQQALQTRRGALEDSHPDVVYTLESLAANSYYQGDYPEALKYFQNTLQIQQQAFGPDDPGVARALNNVAIMYDTLGDYAKAIEHYQRALEIDEGRSEPDHSDIATTLSNLAIVYRKQGKYAEAKAMSERSVVVIEKALGPDHPELAKNLTSLAILHKEQGSYSTADTLTLRALGIQEKALDPDHPDLADSLNLLAEINLEQDHYAEAESLFLRAQVIWETRLGPSHPDLAGNFKGLANLYRDQGRYSEAEALYERAGSILEATFGPDHPDVMALRADRAILLRLTGRTEQAAELESAATAKALAATS